MCGVPYRAYEGYLNRLTAAGYKVAIYRQTEDPAKNEGLVNREIVRIVTPGTTVASGDVLLVPCFGRRVRWCWAGQSRSFHR